MDYVLVGVASSVVTKEPLTYQAESGLEVGSIVLVPLRKRLVPGVVMEILADKPAFKTKSVSEVLSAKLPSQQLDLLNWLRSYYPAPLSEIVKLFVPSFILKPRSAGQVSSEITLKAPALTGQQASVMHSIKKSASQMVWLHGETGSGKTRIYQELALQTLKSGRQVLVLSPEIGLSAHIASAFETAFGSPVLEYNSNLGSAKRAQIWYDVANAVVPRIIIGPRSALFLPIKNLGLIVIDEAHDGAYKQDQAPRYQAIPVAAKLAGLSGARLLLGSATPNVADLWQATKKNVPALTMTGQAVVSDHPPAKVTIIDQKKRDNFSAHPHFSDELLAALKTASANQEQSLLLLNRRGTARIVLCSTCGWQADCPVCHMPLTYHHDDHRLRCHICGFNQPMPSSCPVCQSVEIVFKSAGTKAIIEELRRLLPMVSLLRFDTDNRAHERLDRHVGDLQNSSAGEVIVGTQLIGKGLDLPHLSVVGVLNADTSLHLPDYRAEEKTYQLLSQIIGRVGRGHRAGSVYIQTYQPDHPVLMAAATRNWQAFYDRELEARRQYHFPPFIHMAKLWCERKTRASAQKAAGVLAEKLKREPRIFVQGPAPAFHEHVPGGYRWQIVIKSAVRSRLVQVAESLPSGWIIDLDPDNLL